MAYDSAGFQPAVKPALTERAQFALWLAQRPNEVVGEQHRAMHCALARCFGRASPSEFGEPWEGEFAYEFDALGRQPTGFDALCILQRIPA